MSKIVAVPDDLYDKAEEVAAKDQVSIEESVSAAVAKRLASREYIESQARLFNREDFARALNEIPDVEPEEHDRLKQPSKHRGQSRR
jgi:flagellar motility protein MotE (MotC chaperone)